VPLSWQSDSDGAFASAPDGSTIAIERPGVTNWSAYKGDLRHAYGNRSVIHEDGDRRLWIEAKDGSRVTHHIAVLTGSTVCSSVLELRGDTRGQIADTVSRIADSIGPG